MPAVAGRGLTAQKHHFLAGLPRIDGDRDPRSVAEGSRAMAQLVRNYWPAPAAPEVRTLPTVLSTAELPAAVGDLRLPLGLAEADLEPVWYDAAMTLKGVPRVLDIRCVGLTAGIDLS